MPMSQPITGSGGGGGGTIYNGPVILFTPVAGGGWLENQTTAGLLMGTLTMTGVTGTKTYVSKDQGAVKYTITGNSVYSTTIPWDYDSPLGNRMRIEVAVGTPDNLTLQEYVVVPLANDPLDDEPTKLWDMDFVNNVATGSVTLANFNSVVGDLTAGVGLKMNGLGNEYIMPYSLTPNSWSVAGVDSASSAGTIDGFAAIDVNVSYGWRSLNHLRNMAAGEKALIQIKIGRYAGDGGGNGWQVGWSGSALNTSDAHGNATDVLGAANTGGLPTGVVLLTRIADATNNAQTLVYGVTAQNTGSLTVQMVPRSGSGKWRLYGCQSQIVADFAVYPTAWVATTTTIVTSAGTTLTLSGAPKTLLDSTSWTICAEFADMVNTYPAPIITRGATTGLETNVLKAINEQEAGVHTLTSKAQCGLGGYLGGNCLVLGYDSASGGTWTAGWNGELKTGTGTIPTGVISKMFPGVTGTLLRVSGYTGKLGDGQILTRSRITNRASPSATVGPHKGLGTSLHLGYASANRYNFDARNYGSADAMFRRRALKAGETDKRDNSQWVGEYYLQRDARYRVGGQTEPMVDTFFSEPNCKGTTFNNQHEMNLVREAYEDLAGYVNGRTIGADGELVITALLYSGLSAAMKGVVPKLNDTTDPLFISTRATFMDLTYAPGDYVEVKGYCDRDSVEKPWPAPAWAIHDEGGGNQREDDIMEGLDGFIDSFFATGHFNSYSLGDDKWSSPYPARTGGSDAANFHTWGLLTSSDGTKFSVYKDGRCWGGPYDRSTRNWNLVMTIVMNLAMGGFMGSPAGAATRKMALLRMTVYTVDGN